MSTLNPTTSNFRIYQNFFLSRRFLPNRLLVVAITGVKQVAGKPLNLLTKIFSAQSYPPCNKMSDSNPCIIYSNGIAGLKVSYVKGSTGEKSADQPSLIDFTQDDDFVPEEPFQEVKPCVCQEQLTFSVDNMVYTEFNSVLSLYASGTNTSENNDAISSLSDSCKSDTSSLIPIIVYGSVLSVLLLGGLYLGCKKCKRSESQREYQQIQNV